MKTFFKITKSKADNYRIRNACTIDIRDIDFVQIEGRIIKDELKNGEEYITIQANQGGSFSSDWVNSDLKILYILRESYILKKSFYYDSDRGGHRQNEEYITNNELWENVTYRNLVKITYYTYYSKLNVSIKDVDFIQDEVWDEACDIFRKHAAVICVNPFPALAFNSTKTDLRLLKEWVIMPEVQDMLKGKIQQLNPKCIYAAFDLGLVSSSRHLFGWLKGRTLSELVDIEGGQSILGTEVVSGGMTQYNAYSVDKTGKVWVQGIHPSARLSHKRMMNIASGICFAETVVSI